MITKEGQGSWGLEEAEEATETGTTENERGNNMFIADADLVFD